MDLPTPDPTRAPVHADFMPLDRYLHVRLREPQRLDRAPVLFRTVWSEASAMRQERVLLDLRESPGHLQDHETTQAGHLASWGLQGLRVAVLAPPPLQPVGHMADVASQQGLACRAFHDEGEALDWLAGGPAQPVRRASASM